MKPLKQLMVSGANTSLHIQRIILTHLGFKGAQCLCPLRVIWISAGLGPGSVLQLGSLGVVRMTQTHISLAVNVEWDPAGLIGGAGREGQTH